MEKNWWDRVYFYSSLYDNDDIKGVGIRTPAQKFIQQGKVAARKLVSLNYLTHEEGENFATSVLSRVPPGTLNGGALALAYTTYDPLTRTYLETPSTTASADIKAYQKRRCWRTLVKKLEDDPGLASFKQDYGVTAPDLLRYFYFLRNLRTDSYSMPVQEEEDQEQDV
jgi:hypothetical protein